jgi:YbbR domain-containing protein
MKTKQFHWLNPYRHYQRLKHLTFDELKDHSLKLLALCLAFILYLISQQPQSELLFVSVPVEFNGLRQGLEISSEKSLPTVNVRVSGPRDVVRELTVSQLAVSANLSNKEPGERTIQLKPKDVLLPEGVKVLQIEPANLTLLLETTARKQAPVEANIAGQAAEGFELYGVTVEPPTIELEGPQSKLDPVKLVKTESISLKGNSASLRVSADIELPHPSLRAINQTSVSLFIEIGERRGSRLLKNLPVHWVNQPPQARLLTQTVEALVVGPRAALDALRESDVRVEVNAANLPPNAVAAKPQIHLPAALAKQIEIRNVKPSEVKIKP